jgi:hypothetical protein
MFIIMLGGRQDKLAAGITGSGSGGSVYSGRVDVTASTYSALLADKRKRHRLLGTGSTQVITLPSIAGLAQEDFYLFDNKCGGVAKQVKLLTAGVDVILFNGFNLGSNNFNEFWIDKGQSLMLAKVDGAWELIFPYQGTNVGERFAATFKDHPGTVLEDGQIGQDALDGDELPRLWWWLQNVLTNTHFIVDNTVINTSYVHPVGKEGLFVVHSTLKKFRTPNTQGLSEKGLLDFDNYGADTSRIYDYPGGKQLGKVGDHRHFCVVPSVVSGGSGPNANTSIVTQNDSGPGDFKYILFGSGAEPSTGRSGKPVDPITGTAINGSENIVTNIGVIYLRRI